MAGVVSGAEVLGELTSELAMWKRGAGREGKGWGEPACSRADRDCLHEKVTTKHMAIVTTSEEGL